MKISRSSIDVDGRFHSLASKTCAIGCEPPMTIQTSTIQTSIEEAHGLDERHCTQHCVEDLADAHDATFARRKSLS
jgi:hypothetical protein